MARSSRRSSVSDEIVEMTLDIEIVELKRCPDLIVEQTVNEMIKETMFENIAMNDEMAIIE